MKKNYLLLLGLALMMSFVFVACEDDEPEDPEIPNEEEAITTLTYTLTPDDGGMPVVLSFVDLDGDGGNDPVVTGGTLDTNATYVGAIVLLNDLETPPENITEEVEEEDDEHQFFFTTTVNGLDIDYADTDGNGNPLGLATTITTKAAGSGTITVILRHEPDKAAAGVSEGDIANAGGETDIEVTFDVDVQ